MGRLQTLTAFAAVALATPLVTSCDDAASSEPKARSEVVAGSTSTTTSATVTAPTAQVSATPTVRKPRKLCAQKPAADGKKLADVKFGHVEATGESPGPDELVTGKGRWTWINLWAGWCGPCKEEMPMLAQWAVALKDKLRFEFVSVDEDERLAVRFLNAQPSNGLRASHHLAEGDAKKTWLDSAGIGEITKLPMHVLVDPDGAIRCVITGEVDPGDLDQVKALVGAN